MSGQMNWRKKYEQSLRTMHGPYKPSDIPNIEIDLKGMSEYAKKMHKTVPELSKAELSPFILNASIDRVMEEKIQC